MDGVFDRWMVRVGGQPYGPYTDEMMGRFVREGRVGPRSEITADASAGFFAAERYAEFARWMGVDRANAHATSSPKYKRHLVMAELRSGQALAFLNQLQTYLQSSRIGDTVWLVDGAPGTEELTGALKPTLHVGDRMYVVDVTDREPGTYGFLDISRSA